MNKVGREWIAIVISLGALAFSGLQWLESRWAREAAMDATIGRLARRSQLRLDRIARRRPRPLS